MIKNWKKALAAVALVAMASITQVNAQDGEPPFVKGSKSIGISMGFGVDYGYSTYYGGSYTNSPAFAFTYDQGFFENVGPGTIGIGGVVGFKSSKYKYAGYKSTYTNYIIGVRGTYHLTLLAEKNNKFDPYAGVTIGLRFFNYKDNDPYDNDIYDYRSVYPIAGAFVGAKYNFTPAFGAFGELGYDISFLRLGVNFNF